MVFVAITVVAGCWSVRTAEKSARLARGEDIQMSPGGHGAGQAGIHTVHQHGLHQRYLQHRLQGRAEGHGLDQHGHAHTQVRVQNCI